MKRKLTYIDRDEAITYDLVDTVVAINRTAAVVKGGRRFSFSALTVVGNENGVVGVGFGKAKDVPSAMEKAKKDGYKHLVRISRKGQTIPHAVMGVFGASRVKLIPAAPGTGIIAGGAVRSVVEKAGIKDILTKAYGSRNPINLVKATLDGLARLRTREEVQKLRGVNL